MANLIRSQVYAIHPLKAIVRCHFCDEQTGWERRPELVYRGLHRYPRWVCNGCGRTSHRSAQYAENLRVTISALVRGPGTPEWDAYTKTDTYA